MKMLFVFMLCLMSAMAFGADPSIVAPPEWLSSFLVFLGGIPTVGPIIVEVLKWVSVVATVFTALSVTVSALLKVPELAAKWSGATEFSDKIAKLNAQIQPYLKYLSIFNVKK